MINDLKEKIIDSRLKHKLLDNLSDYQFNLEDAYNIQEEINNTLSINGLGKIIGYKLGCTNKAIQRELNINEPIYGALFKNKLIKNNAIGAASTHKNQTTNPPNIAPKLFPVPPTITITQITKVYLMGL